MTKNVCSQTVIQTVIVGMVFARTHRIALSSALAVLIALGGYYTGYAQTTHIRSELNLDNPSFLGKVPRNSIIPFLRANSDAMGIKPEEMREIDSKVNVLMKEYVQAQREAWKERVQDAKLAENGMFLNSSGRNDAGGYAEMIASVQKEKPLMSANAKIEITVFRVLGVNRMKIVLDKMRKTQLDESAKAFSLMMDPVTIDQLQLSKAQRNQMVLLEAFTVDRMGSDRTFPDHAYYLSDVLPKRSEIHDKLMRANARLKEDHVEKFKERLSPLQVVKFEMILRDKLYVEL